MIKMGVCDQCSKRDVVGYVGCLNKHLCPACTADRFEVSEEMMRTMMDESRAHDDPEYAEFRQWASEVLHELQDNWPEEDA